MITRLEKLLEVVAGHPKKRLAVAAAHERTVLEAVKEAVDRGIADAILVGRGAEIEDLCQQLGLAIDPAFILDVRDDAAAARTAAQQVSQGHADIVMKGHIHTDDFLRGILDKDVGLRSAYTMSHVFILELVAQERLMFVTDGAFNVAPDLVRKAEIILNAVYLAQLFGIQQPTVAVLAAVEVVSPNMPATIEAAALAQMSRRGQFSRGIVDGPFALDNAVSLSAAQHKGLAGDVAGKADILLVPDIEAGNMLAKAHVYFAGGEIAGVVVGAAAPVVLTSRADTPQAKLYSIATAILMATLKRDLRLKIGKIHY